MQLAPERDLGACHVLALVVGADIEVAFKSGGVSLWYVEFE